MIVESFIAVILAHGSHTLFWQTRESLAVPG
jgi:hypothetical protein